MAVTSVTSLQACLNLIEGLGDKVGMNSPSLVMEQIAFYRGIKSPENTRGLTPVRTIGNDGRNLTVQYDYFEPDCSDAVDGAIDLCNLAENIQTTPKKSLTTTLTRAKHRSGTVDFAEYRDLCETHSEVASHFLSEAAKAIIRDMSIDCYQLMKAECGDYPVSGDDSVTATKTINVVNADGNVNIGALSAIKNAFGRHEGTPIMFGGQVLQQAQDIASISSRSGGVNFDPDKVISGLPIFSDYKIDDALQDPGTSDSFAIVARPGAFRLIEDYVNVGVWEVLNDDRITRTVIEIYGVKFDFYSKFDPECMKYSWLLQKQYDLFCVPNTEYADCLDYTNKLLFKLGCGPFDCNSFRC